MITQTSYSDLICKLFHYFISAVNSPLQLKFVNYFSKAYSETQLVIRDANS